jgi:hypothetical protein
MSYEFMSREDFIENIVKVKAREYLDLGEPLKAYNSFASDMLKHPETKNHMALMLGMQLMLTGNLNTTNQVRDFIEKVS